MGTRFTPGTQAAPARQSPLLVGLLAFGLTLLASPASAAVDVAQRPLFLGANVPGNLVLTPSVEFPTVISVANIQTTYSTAASFRATGYFDPGKCYRYHFSSIEAERHFYPTRFTANRLCTGEGEWSGHFLNWAATQTIDAFRLAMTGGKRVRDTPTETWLQKARADRVATGNFPRRTLSGESLIESVTPAEEWDTFNMRIDGLGHRMWFTASGSLTSGSVVPFDPAVHALDEDDADSGQVFEVSVRVAVCVPGLLEPNCVRYAQGYKPEGLIQEHAGRGSVGPAARPRLRFSIFGYTNISGMSRDGGVMRANSKFVGPFAVDNTGAMVPNPEVEWDPVTGVLHRNPNPADAAATNTALGLTTAPDLIQHSGVINYLNLFGEVATRRQMKSQDPVSELFYAALRYVKNQPPVPEFSNNLGATPADRFDAADGFPVLTNWRDPIAFHCQSNVFLGIGDTNTWQDKNLPGNTNSTQEPAKPPLVAADTTVDVVRFMGLINDMERQEGNVLPAADVASFSGRNNSAYIAALAYHANTQDLRPDLPGKQTAQTFWVDVLENRVLANRRNNMYWLAAKYGGFRPSPGFDPLTNTAAIPVSQWNSTGEILSTGDRRPDNFFPAGDATRMVEALSRAFDNIVASVEGSGVSFATNTTRLEANARVFQASFFSGAWRGELDAYSVNPATGALSNSPVWSAGNVVPVWNARDLWVNSNGFRRFDSFSALAAADQTALGTAARMDYLRGDRSNEAPNGANFRVRQSMLGTFVNSQPIFVGRPDPRQFQGASFAGAAAYSAFATTWVNRKPIVYLGSNGGFLHGFNANTGVEEFAFMPNGVLRNQIGTLADPGYTHRYQVDGDPVVAEVFDTVSNTWRTILVGTMGRGGRSVFALDVTNPDSVQFLWERTEVQIPELGNALNRPVIGQVASGDWRVFLGNGINGSGRADLIMIDVMGTNPGRATVVTTGADTANGLTGVAVADTNGDFIADAVYGGDFKGNLWRFTGLAHSPVASRLFTARSPSNEVQPITASPRVAKNPIDNALWVFFGTGSYLNENDLGDRTVQTWYGLRDDGGTIAGRAELNRVRIIDEGVVGGRLARAIELVPPSAMVGRRGWFIDLVGPSGTPAGERMVESNQFQGLTLLGTSRIPNADDVCAPGGTGFIMAIDPFTGGRRPGNFFDVNRDLTINAGDNLNGVPVSGIGFASAPNSPTFLGRVMQVSMDDRSRETFLTDAGAGLPRRVSWREIVNE
ncbi:PilC/PilY family type IV pilus protein [Silanimonas sp.]|uniref:pilus assembly protein n=1 Tax=Silanimonas sp. TaxID=1929290 RepID=UPI001BBBC17D|nr:PilC/PilY family type IV pilus protein [Silanimonas sp.]MBS3897037.1 hypothetical protein [Silanimonas sp.]MBS3924013.1 hypothetical protein [Xanthomonadaceae bacterium]